MSNALSSLFVTLCIIAAGGAIGVLLWITHGYALLGLGFLALWGVVYAGVSGYGGEDFSDDDEDCW